MTCNELRILELYSGIGGMHYAAKVAKFDAQVVFSVDINTAANEVYHHNFPQTNQQARNIQSLSPHEINNLAPNIIMMSPPCQPFTRVGLKLDKDDPRCSSFIHLLEILPDLATVKYILMENVVGFETSAMRSAFVETLRKCQFYFREFILSPECLDVPNSRNRYYLIARKEKFSFGSENELNHSFPAPVIKSHLGKVLEPYLETIDVEALEDYLISDKTLSKYWRILDIRQKTSESSCCFTKAYTHYAEGTGSVYKHEENLSLDKCFEEFRCNAENVTYLRPLKLRYFTPREVANLMGFPKEFQFPPTTSLKTRYRLLGNSLNVLVVANLVNLLTTSK